MSTKERPTSGKDRTRRNERWSSTTRIVNGYVSKDSRSSVSSELMIHNADGTISAQASFRTEDPDPRARKLLGVIFGEKKSRIAKLALPKSPVEQSHRYAEQNEVSEATERLLKKRMDLMMMLAER